MDKKDISKVTSLSNFPLTFEKNIGQKDKEAKFLVRGQGYTAFFTEKEVVLTLMKIKKDESTEKEDSKLIPHKIDDKNKKAEYEVSVLRMSLEGANSDLEIIGENEQEGKVNYFKGNKPENWVTNVPIYEKIRYKEVYQGIDVIFYGNPKQLEHDFIVKPGADPNNISFNLQGAENIDIDNEGNLVIKVKTGELTLRKPTVFQEVNGGKKEVESSYNLRENNKIGFKLDSYDSTADLNIDPVLDYSTYLGGSSEDYGRGIAVDKSGNAYVTGWTYSSDFPVTSGAYQTNLKGNQDVFITKINTNGTALVYSTYLGGSSVESGYGIAVDDVGCAYVTGETTSRDFPVTSGAYQTNLKVYQDVFITKINTNGTALVYSTYLGGSSVESGYGIAVDDVGCAYVTGETTSRDFPVTSGAYQTNLKVYQDVFITKINTNGTNLVYSTYLGGSFGAKGNGIAVDDVGSAYVIGATYSSDFPVTSGAYQTNKNGDYDAFITKINTNGTALVYSTYLGGSSDEYGDGIAVDDVGSAYVTGVTFSSDFPVTSGAYQTNLKGYTDAFITKINTNGTALVYSTYLGPSDGNGGDGIAVDGLGNAYVTGWTTSRNFPVTSGAYQTNNKGGIDIFITKINTNGTALVYSTYLGGSSDEYGNGIAVDDVGSVYVTGLTYSNDFPVTSGADDTTYNGAGDAFITKFIASADLIIEKIAVPDPVIIGGELEYIVKVTNNGLVEAFGVVVTDILPSSVQFILGLPSKGSINYSSGIVTWNIGSLDIGEVITLTIKVKATAVGTISNTATVTVGGVDSNNTVTITSTVIDIYEEIDNINTTVNDIEDKLDGTKPSLITEMKEQLDDIEGKIDSIIPGAKLTTGPVVKDSNACTLVIAINNSKAIPVTVQLTVVDYTVTPVVNCSYTESIPANSMRTVTLSKVPVQYEVIFDGMIPGVYGWTSTRSSRCCPFIASNTFRHAELVKKEE